MGGSDGGVVTVRVYEAGHAPPWIDTVRVENRNGFVMVGCLGSSEFREPLAGLTLPFRVIVGGWALICTACAACVTLIDSQPS